MIKVYFLGTGGGMPSKNRRLPAFLMKREGFSALFDCGEGTQYTFTEYGLSSVSLDLIGITHMHGDHVLGLIGLIESMGMLDRKKPLNIMGPKRLKEFLYASFEMSHFRPKFELRFIDEYKGNGIRVKKFETCHTVTSQGYILEEEEKVNLDIDRLKAIGVNDWNVLRKIKGGEDVTYEGRILHHEDYIIKRSGSKVVYTGDTRPCENTVNASKDAALLIHDSTFLDEPSALTYGHSNVSEAATIAQQSNVNLLALTHISARYPEPEPLIQAAKKIFPRVTLPNDLSFINVE
ncbi:ribonuclease Z [Sulfuracidifex metallicus]|uniref:Ribonuclease Z n=1 Tax=Sulfuracidifex metallicus DSM 6482 = JCM 9184 TaxID=523847 RepID=A0A6A9QLT4_SULME|nr:ribonuclease Z [Sulfuracidifex metallicus]MUN29966.1 ribonuclease Z [Sulfuracidifex metallicus DSM 6482 = JCM 9184]WOE51651.1 ribonuclease Z [Sulfuracidifex metallicus DSM 6482 = JCM 9184]